MFQWKMAPKNKKSVRESEFWSKSGETIQYSHWWSSGSITLFTATNNPPQIDLQNAGEDGLCVTELEDGETILEVEVDDFLGGVGEEWFALSEDVTEDELNTVRLAWDDEWSEGVEKLGWCQEHAEVRFYGELVLEPFKG